MDKFNKLIAYLMVVQGYAKDIHYSCHGIAFYGKHLFADRIQDGWYGYIDLIKEVCLLGNELSPLPSSDYDRMAADLTPPVSEDDDQLNFQRMKEFLTGVLEFIENMNDLTKGEENLIGAIAQDLQQMLGLVNRQVMETKFIELIKDFPPAPKISEEELKNSPLYGFNCCGEIVEFPNLRGD